MGERITFLNTFLRTPKTLFRDNQRYRIPELLPFLTSTTPLPSIIGLAEVFRGFRDDVKRYADNFGYDSIVDSCGFLQSSGIMFLYNNNIWGVMDYIMYKFNKCAGYDCLANKGFLVIKLIHRQTNKIVYFIVTHLNANEKKSSATAKIQNDQLNQIKDFINYSIPLGGSMIIMGDFNIDIMVNKFKYLSKNLHSLGSVGNPKDYTTNEWSAEGFELLDYIITKNIKRANTVRVLQYDSNAPLSDHNAITRIIHL